MRVEPAIAIGIAIPVVAALVTLGVRHVRRRIARAELGALGSMPDGRS